MPSIDERVVAMSFENQEFERRVAQTMGTLSKLDTSLKNLGGTSGFDKIEQQASKVTLQGPMSALDKLKSKFGRSGADASQAMGEIERASDKVTLQGTNRAVDNTQAKLDKLSAGQTFTDIENASSRTTLVGLSGALDTVTQKFSVLQGAASVALGNIASQAISRGAGFAKSFAFGPIAQGMGEYQTNLGSIQTILSNTEGQQVSGLQNVQKYLGELNTYSDQTIYNFSEMARNIGTFTAAGVQLPQATQSIKGIANLAAASGSSSQQASTAMYQLSQAIAAGRVGLQDWNSVVNAGMGGALFQKALMRTAENMGALKDGAVEIDKATGRATVNGASFRESIMAKPGQTSWLSSDVLTSTLQQFTGDLSDAELAAQGFTAEQIKAIQQTAKTAQNAATQVKTLPQVFDVARETIGSGWSKTFQLIFGDFEQSKETFTALSQTINGFINRTSDARNKFLEQFNELGGRVHIIAAIKSAFWALEDAIRPVIQAFRDVFPPAAPQGLISFIDHLNHLADVARAFFQTNGPQLRDIFGGIFAVIHIGWNVIKELVGVFFDLLGVVGEGSGGFLNFLAVIGDFLKGVDQALTQGGALHGFFQNLAAVISLPIQLLFDLSGAITGLFTGANAGRAEAFGNTLASVSDAAGPLGTALDFLSDAWDNLSTVLDRVKTAIEPWLSQAAEAFSNFGTIVGDAFTNMDFDAVFAALQTGLIGGIFLVIRNALKSGIGVDLGGGVLESLSGTFKALTGNLEAMQQNVKAGALTKIAIAIGILAASVTVLAMIDPEALMRAMTAMAIGMGELVAAMAILNATAKAGGIVSMTVLSGTLIALSTSMLIMAGAIRVLSSLSWEEMIRGLAGVGIALVLMADGVKLMGPSTLRAAIGLIPLAVGMNLLAFAVKQMASLEWEDLIRGLIGITGALVGVGSAMMLMGPSILLVGPGLIAAALGVNMLAAAVAAFGAIDPAALLIGIIGVTGAVTALGVAIMTIPPTIAVQAAGLILLSIALSGIAGVIATLGNLDIRTLVQGIAAMAGALAVLGVALTLMSASVAGSAALLLAAGALAVLIPALALLGNLDVGTIVKSLVAMAAIFGVLAAAGALLAAPLTALGIALIPLTAELVAVAGAALIFGKAVQLMGENGPKAIAAVLTALIAFVASLPKIVIDFLRGVVEIANAITKISPQILAALGVMLGQVIAFVTEQAPKLGVAIGALIEMFTSVIDENAPKVIASGTKLLIAFLSGVANNIGAIVTQVGKIITTFLDGLTQQAPRIMASGLRLLITWLQGIASGIGRIIAAGANVVIHFLRGIAQQIPRVVPLALETVVRFLHAVGSKIDDIVEAGIELLVSFLNGIARGIPRVVRSAIDVMVAFIRAIGRETPRLADAGFKALIQFLNGIARAIRENEGDLIRAGINIARAIVDGLVDGLGSVGHLVRGALMKVLDILPGFAKRILGIRSPSSVFAEIGQQTMAGMAVGIEGGGRNARNAIDSVGRDVMSTAQSAFGQLPGIFDGMADMAPVITPVLDLTHIRRGAQELGTLTQMAPIAASASYTQATAISAERQAMADATAEKVPASPEVKKFEFNQYNTSPESLSTVEIYRRTHNQLSLAKSSVGL